MKQPTPSNAHFRTRLQVLDAQLKQLERYGKENIRAAAFERLHEEREVVNLVLLNRRVEAARPVVDLARWRNANGALHLVANENAAGEEEALAG
jgi:hypothetical protein